MYIYAKTNVIKSDMYWTKKYLEIWKEVHCCTMYIYA